MTRPNPNVGRWLPLIREQKERLGITDKEMPDAFILAIIQIESINGDPRSKNNTNGGDGAWGLYQMRQHYRADVAQRLGRAPGVPFTGEEAMDPKKATEGFLLQTRHGARLRGRNQHQSSEFDVEYMAVRHHSGGGNGNPDAKYSENHRRKDLRGKPIPLVGLAWYKAIVERGDPAELAAWEKTTTGVYLNRFRRAYEAWSAALASGVIPGYGDVTPTSSPGLGTPIEQSPQRIKRARSAVHPSTYSALYGSARRGQLPCTKRAPDPVLPAAERNFTPVEQDFYTPATQVLYTPDNGPDARILHTPTGYEAVE